MTSHDPTGSLRHTTFALEGPVGALAGASESHIGNFQAPYTEYAWGLGSYGETFTKHLEFAGNFQSSGLDESASGTLSLKPLTPYAPIEPLHYPPLKDTPKRAQEDLWIVSWVRFPKTRVEGLKSRGPSTQYLATWVYGNSNYSIGSW